MISQCILLAIKSRFVNTEYRVSAKIREQTAFSSPNCSMTKTHKCWAVAESIKNRGSGIERKLRSSA